MNENEMREALAPLTDEAWDLFESYVSLSEWEGCTMWPSDFYLYLEWMV